MTISEIMQYFDIYFYGTTSDLADLIMFCFGALIAAYFDKYIFEKMVPYWKYN